MSYCTPCPPCDSEFPLLCEPLEITANGKRLVVEDSAACQKTLASPSVPSTLTWDNGLKWDSQFNEFTNFTATGTSNARNLVTRFSDVINVRDFGAVGNGTTDDTSAFNSAASAAGIAGCSVYVPKGDYLISSQTTNANWILDNGAQIIGLANQPTAPGNFASLNDTSRLTGNAFNFNNSVFGSGYKPIVRVGTTNPWLSKDWKYVGENCSNFVSSDDQGRPAAIFSTLVSDSSAEGIGYSAAFHTVNNSTGTGKAAWGMYAEHIRSAGAGGLLGFELDMINKGNVVDVTPINSFANGLTVSLWLSCGGGTSSPYGNTGNDTSIAIGLIGNNKKFGRGIVIRDNSINTIGNFGTAINEAISMPKAYGIAWYDIYGLATSTLNGLDHIRNCISSTPSTSAFDISQRTVAGGVTAANDAIYRHQFQNNNGSFNLVGEHLVIQMENFSGTDSRVAQQWTAKNQGAGFSGFHINFASQLSFAPIVDDTHLLGHPSYRWNTIYCTNATINTSDARQKQQIRSANDSEKNVATKLKSAIKAFKFNEAVEKKGADKARWHFGVIAQEVKEIFESEGLNAEEYGLFCYDEWDSKEEIKDEKGNVLAYGREAGNAYGVRYEELISFLITNL